MDGEIGAAPALYGQSQFWPPIAQQIWNMKYRLKNLDGEPVDVTIEDTWRRVATALAAPEREPAHWAAKFYDALAGFRFLPGGRIVAGAGTGRDGVTLFNCFVMGTIPDSISGIFAHLREAALTMQQGGGIGYDFSTLRPKDAPVVGVGADASGPVSFMDVWDAMCRTIESAGYRRGAMMATLRCDHPDIELFVEAKRDPARLRMFNLSVLVTDPFMQAVADDAEWPLVFNGEVFKTVRAGALWDKIMRATYEVAEPGVIFIDRINRRNNLWYCETIAATNPCGEEPLPPYGDCLLGSLNLAALVREPFTPQARIDPKELSDLTGTAVRMLDNVIEISRFPLEEQRAEAFAKRRLGLGVTGLGNALIMAGLRYGSPAAVEATSNWLSNIQQAAYGASVQLAEEKGAFPLFDAAKYLAGETVNELPPELRQAIERHGIRNSHLSAIAPTGTISLYAGNLSGGIEPVFSLAPFTRKLLLPDGSRQEREVADYAYALWRRLRGDERLPEYFVDAQTLAPEDHLAMLAAAQRYIDASVSKTINLPADIPFEAFKDVYAQAYALGCKSCTTYRPNEITGAILSVKGEAAAEPGTAVSDGGGKIVNLTAPLARPDELEGRTYKLRWGGSEHAVYVTINDIVEDSGRRRPFEVFLVSNDAEGDAWRVLVGRLISAIYRRGGDVAFVASEMKAIFDKRGGEWIGGRYVPSLPAAIGAIIERHMRTTGFLQPPEPAADEQQLQQAAAVGSDGNLHSGLARPRALRQCPKCGEAALIRFENCDRCTACDYSKC